MSRSSASSILRVCPSCARTYPGGEMFCPDDGTRLSGTEEMPVVSAEDPLVGTILAKRYRIVRRIGEGGMGIVYEGEHIEIEKRVAIKVLREDYTKRSEVAARFKQEARSASRIGHENIVDVTDFGTTETGGVFFVMEFLEGEDLADVLHRDRHVSAERGIPIVLQVCRALAAAHSKGIIHRDLKPENIYLVERNGKKDLVKILDFGIAKMSELDDVQSGAQGPGRRLTKTGMIFGTPEYMSPEQAAGKPLDHRVDVYAAGVILYEIFAGRVPFMGDTFMGVLTQHLFEAPPPMRTFNPNLAVPRALEAVISRSMAKDPNKRHQTMNELLDDIERAMKDADAVPLVARKVGPAPVATPVSAIPRPAHPHAVTAPDLPTGRFEVRSRLPAILIGSGLLVGVAAAGAWFFLRDGEATAAAAGDRAAEEDGDAPEEGSAGSREEATVPEPPVPPPLPELPTEANVRITVETRPNGAAVTVEGRGEVCSPTPCSFDHPKGEELHLRARHGRAAATKVLTPEDDATVQLTLRGPGRPGGGRPGGGGGGGGVKTGERGGSAGDLKIPSIWKNNP